jgi:uncharacterized protein YqhQ
MLKRTSRDEDNSACRKKVRKTSIGGQALIEGIMMRGPKKISMAVRNPDGDVVVETWDSDAKDRPKYYRLPFLRGVFGFIDSMRFGYKCLMRSAEIAGFDDLENQDDKGGNKKIKKKENTDNKAVSGAERDYSSNDSFNNNADQVLTEEISADIEIAPGKAGDGDVQSPKNEDANSVSENTAESKTTDVKSSGKDNKKSNSVFINAIMVVASVLGVILAIVLFKALPEMLYEMLKKLIPELGGEGYGYQLVRSLFVGILKIIILVAYMALITLMKDIRRTFMYHGAEHKSIMCYEQGLELTVANVRSQRRFHPRCGTSFLILMVIVGIFITMFIPANLSDNGILNVVLRTLISLALLPVMMSVGYELIRIAGKHDNMLTRIISAPGLWLQRITTKEPDDSMVECAIIALNNVIPGDGSDDWDKK